MSDQRLGQLLLNEELISSEQFQSALTRSKDSGRHLTDELARLGFLAEEELTTFLASHFNIKTIDLNTLVIPEDIFNLVPYKIAELHMCIPVRRTDLELTVAMVDPSNLNLIDELAFMTGSRIQPVVASRSAISEAIVRHFGFGIDYDYQPILADFDQHNIEYLPSHESIMKLVNLVLLDSIRQNVSDICIEPTKESFLIQFRIDEVVKSSINPSASVKRAFTIRLKTMAGLAQAERQRPQNGYFTIATGRNLKFHFDVSCFPTTFGEKLILRRDYSSE